MGPSKSKQIFIILCTVLVCSFPFIYSYPASGKNISAITTLLPKINAKIREYPQLFCGIYIKPSWGQSEININGDASFPAASLIKIPIAVILLQEIDKGTFSFSQTLVLKNSHKVSGTGSFKNKSAGTKVSLREAFRAMLVVSDNTATNMIIDFIGGPNACNKKIERLELAHTVLVEPIGSFSKSKNTTSPKDLVTLLERALGNQLLSSSSSKYLKKTLTKVKNKSLITKGIGKFTTFAHKTGTIGICVGDAGIVYLPFWKQLGIAIIVRRPWNDLNGQKFIREISQIVSSAL